MTCSAWRTAIWVAAEIEFKEALSPAADNPFSGKTALATGSFVHFFRIEISKKLDELGTKAGSPVSAKINFVIAGEKAGSELQKTQNLDTTIYGGEVIIVRGKVSATLHFCHFPIFIRIHAMVTVPLLVDLLPHS